MANKIDAFGHIVAADQNSIGVEGGDGLLPQYGLEVDKTNGAAVVVEKDPISIPDLVASYEDQCGMEWAKRMLRSGQVDPSQLADDGKHGGDFTGSTELNVAYRNAQAAKAQGDQVAKSLGIEGDYVKAEDLDALVKEKVAAIIEAQKAASEGETK